MNLMLRKFKTDNGRLHEIYDYEDGAWIVLTEPERDELEEVARKYEIDIADVRAAMDDEESSRIDINDDYAMLLFDIPSVEVRHKQEVYTTIPIGMILVQLLIWASFLQDLPEKASHLLLLKV